MWESQFEELCGLRQIAFSLALYYTRVSLSAGLHIAIRRIILEIVDELSSQGKNNVSRT
jgi:hypothetical protein